MKKTKGFTLAEIIIAMTIIGVIAAMTIPALLVSVSEKALEAQKKALLARISQSVSQIEDLRIYARTKTSGSTVTDNDSALNFVKNAFSKVYRITQICGMNELYEVCDFPEEISTQNNSILKIAENADMITYLDNATQAGLSTFNNLNTNLIGIKTANGESMVVYYNPNCRGNDTNGYYDGNAAAAMCLNFVYDLNGSKEAPNEVGKDVGFLTVFFPKDPVVVSPTPYSVDSDVTAAGSYLDAIDACKKDNKSLIIPNSKEGMAMALNKKLTNISDTSKYAVTGAGATEVYAVDVSNLTGEHTATWSSSSLLRCVYNM